MNNQEHILLCVLGRTASGKDSLINMLCERTSLKQLMSYSTRPRRDGEGDTHMFVSTDDYRTMFENGEVAVDTNIDGNLYWSTIKQLYEADVYIVDYIGLKKLQQLNLPNIRLVSVFINVPDDVREDRALNKRRDDKNRFRSRNLDERAQFREMLKDANFDYAVSNIDFSKAYSILKWIAMAEGLWKNHREDTTE